MTYKELINTDPVMLVEFFATWCPHCRAMQPVVGQVKELLDGRVPVVQLDLDKNSDEADEAGVRSVPTFIVYKDGKEMWRHSGEIQGDVLLSKVEEYYSD